MVQIDKHKYSPKSGPLVKLKKRIDLPVIMKKNRRIFAGAFKAQVAIEALKERKTLAEWAKLFDLHPQMISKWKQEFMVSSKYKTAKANHGKPERRTDPDLKLQEPVHHARRYFQIAKRAESFRLSPF